MAEEAGEEQAVVVKAAVVQEVAAQRAARGIASLMVSARAGKTAEA